MVSRVPQTHQKSQLATTIPLLMSQESGPPWVHPFIVNEKRIYLRVSVWNILNEKRESLWNKQNESLFETTSEEVKTKEDVATKGSDEVVWTEVGHNKKRITKCEAFDL